MPYKIIERDGKFCVMHKDKTVKCHDSKGAAEAHLKALYANVSEAHKLAKAGNIENLARHLANRYGGDPGFFTKCVGVEELSGYDADTRKAICARAHKIVTGIWPGEHGAQKVMYAPFTKVDAERRTVFGLVSDETPDLEDEIVDYEATKTAVADWSQWRNVREMHQPSAVGVAEEIFLDDATRSFSIAAKIVDDAAWEKVKAGVYKGFSIGGKKIRTALEHVDGRPIRRVLEYLLSEISLADRPANPKAVFTLVKRADPSGLRKGAKVKRRQRILAKRASDLAVMRKSLEEAKAKVEEAGQATGIAQEELAALEQEQAALSAGENAVTVAELAVHAAENVAAAAAGESIGPAERQQVLSEAQETISAAQDDLGRAEETVTTAREAAPAETETVAMAEEAVVAAQEAVDAAEQTVTAAEEQIGTPETPANGQPTGDETPPEGAASEETPPEAPADAAEMTPEQTKAIKAVVMGLLQELGLVSSGGEVALAAEVTDLRKNIAGIPGFDVRLTKAVNDVAHVAIAVEELEERLGLVQKMASGQGPVLREIGPSEIGSQDVALLKTILAETNDPRMREAVGQRLAELEIKTAQPHVISR